MPSLKEIKIKIGSTKKTKKITAAMKLVAAAKVNKMQKLIKAARPYANAVKKLYSQLQDSLDPEQLEKYPLLKTYENVSKVLLVIISSDIGLCGPYNANIQKLARQRIEELKAEGVDIELLTIGRKATDFFSKDIYKDRNINIISHIFSYLLSLSLKRFMKLVSIWQILLLKTEYKELK